MKRFAVFLALAGVTSIALAQSPAPARVPPPGWAARTMTMRMRAMEKWRLHQLTVLLDLSAAQQQQIKAIIAEQHAAMRTSMLQVMRAMRAARAAHVAAQREMMSKMAQVLSPAQMAKFKVLMPPHRWFMMRRMRPRGMGMGMGRGMGMGVGPGNRPPPPSPPRP